MACFVQPPPVHLAAERRTGDDALPLGLVWLHDAAGRRCGIVDAPNGVQWELTYGHPTSSIPGPYGGQLVRRVGPHTVRPAGALIIPATLTRDEALAQLRTRAVDHARHCLPVDVDLLRHAADLIDLAVDQVVMAMGDQWNAEARDWLAAYNERPT
jgi:hypothetical protein